MSRKLDISDQIFHRLLALVTDWYKTKETGHTHWFCQCECNNIVSVCLYNLKSGHTKSCGCLQKEIVSQRREDLTGQTFTRWYVDSYSSEKSKEMKTLYYNVTCTNDGNKRCVSAGALKNGKSKSCGCLRRELTSKRCIEDLTDQLFTRWYVNNYNPEKSKEMGKPYWDCVCICGTEKCVSASGLKSGDSQSCGCLNREMHLGKNNPSWKGGVTSIQEKIRKSKKYKDFIQLVLKQFNYTCQLSGQVGGDLHVHHIKGFAKILEENNVTTWKQAKNCKELWDEDNMVVLSEKWHKGIKTDNPNAFHKLYGTKDFIEEDFYKWFNRFKIDFKESIS